MSHNRATTIRSALHDAAARIAGISDSPDLDAGLLLTHVLARPRSYLIAHADDPLAADAAARFRALVARRRAGAGYRGRGGHDRRGRSGGRNGVQKRADQADLGELGLDDVAASLQILVVYVLDYLRPRQG